MTFYQELQLNQTGSKTVIRNAGNVREKRRHLAVYLFKIVITIAFCMAFVIGYSSLFGNENSIAGVAMLLCILTFRFADLGIRTTHAVWIFPVIFAIMAFGPRLANAGGIFTEFGVNLFCIMGLLVLGCHNVIMFNHSTLVLCYLLLYGYDVTGEAYLYRVLGIFLGGAATMIVYYRNHRAKEYKREWRHLFSEFDFRSSRTKWQMQMAFGIASAVFLAGLFGLPRRMWTGIAVMSVMVPFRTELKERVKGRIPGNLVGAVLFLVAYFLLPEEIYSYMGIIGGIGVGLSATYRWQAVFNSLGAISVAVGSLGLPGAVFYRVIHNIFGAVYGLLFERLFHSIMEWRGNSAAEC